MQVRDSEPSSTSILHGNLSDPLKIHYLKNKLGVHEMCDQGGYADEIGRCRKKVVDDVGSSRILN
jgi:hypothetical protein